MKYPIVVLKRSKYDRLRSDLAVIYEQNRELKEEIIALRYESRKKAKRSE